jgi:exopolysaccharide production protein ExoQ
MTFAEARQRSHLSGTIASLRDQFAPWICIAVLFGCMTLILVKITYIAAAPADDPTLNAMALQEAADGDDSKKFFYILFFGSVFLFSGWQKMLDAISIPYRLAVGWSVLSCVWAIDPGISIRRSISMVMILLVIGASVRILGARRSLLVVYWFMATVLVTSFVAVVGAMAGLSVFSFAIHPANEVDTSLIGAWRGVMMHKNVAGAVMTHASIIFLHFALNRKRKMDWLFFFGSILFLVGTKSKTSLALDGVILTVGILYRVAASHRGGLKLFFVSFLGLVASGALICYAIWDQITLFFSDPASVSGRVAIWTSLLTFIRAHPWLGSGYGSFWAIGPNSPINPIAIEPFVAGVGHSHSGYFEILVTCGIVGLCLALYALIVWPFYRLLTIEPRDANLGALCMSLWLFGVLQNFTESQFFAADKQSWMFVVIAICLVQNLAVDRERTKKVLQARPRWLSPARQTLPDSIAQGRNSRSSYHVET